MLSLVSVDRMSECSTRVPLVTCPPVELLELGLRVSMCSLLPSIATS